MADTVEAAIIGAGPYGLSAAAHLRAAGLDARVFGTPMRFWSERMPRGMLLRSPWAASHISDPGQRLTLDTFESVQGRRLSRPLPLEDFVSYGRWFARETVADADPRLVRTLERRNGSFRLTLDDGHVVDAGTVVVAAGIAPFARRSAVSGLPSELVSHSSDHAGLERFGGQRVVVVGAGQSAIESAVLLHEAGANVEVVIRAAAVHWLTRSAGLHRYASVLYAPTDVGPAGVSWVVAYPRVFRGFPAGLQEWMARRSIRPAAAAWLVPRSQSLGIRTSTHIVGARARESMVELDLSTGEQLVADHLMLATGFEVDIRNYDFIAAELREQITVQHGIPVLRRGLESSVRGLHFGGAPAALTYGPLMRFVAGTASASQMLTRRLVRAPRRAPR